MPGRVLGPTRVAGVALLSGKSPRRGERIAKSDCTNPGKTVLGAGGYRRDRDLRSAMAGFLEEVAFELGADARPREGEPRSWPGNQICSRSGPRG